MKVRDGVRYYNCWAGNPTGWPEDKKRCIAAVWSGGRGSMEGQCSNKRRPGSDYCGTHDPENVAKRRARSEERYKRHMAAVMAPVRREERLLAQAKIMREALSKLATGLVQNPCAYAQNALDACMKLEEK